MKTKAGEASVPTIQRHGVTLAVPARLRSDLPEDPRISGYRPDGNGG